MFVRPGFTSFQTEPVEEVAPDEVPEPVAEVKPEPVKVVKLELTILEKILKVENIQVILEKRTKLV